MHGINLNYFCMDCNKSACCECKMFGEHQSHSFQPITEIYKQKYSKIRDLLSTLKTKIIQKEELLTDIENNLIAIKNNTETQIAEIDDFTEKYRNKIALDTAADTHSQDEAAHAFTLHLQELAELREVILARVDQASRTHRYGLDHPLLDYIERTLTKSKELLAVDKNVGSV